MKRIVPLAAAVLLAIALTPATAGAGLGGGGTGMVTIVHDATYDAEEPFPVTLCVDGAVFAGGQGQDPFEWGDILGPVELTATDYEVEIFVGAVADCTGTPAIGPETLTVTPGADVTAAAIWTSAGPALTVWPNDSSCYEPETSTRLTVRHGADTGGQAVDVVGTVDGSEITIVSGLAEGAQETVDLPGGIAATGVAVVPAGGGAPLITLGDLTLAAGTHYVVYAGGGNDGGAGVFVDEIAMEPCPVTTTTTAPTTTTTAAVAPAAVAAAPRFTG